MVLKIHNKLKRSRIFPVNFAAKRSNSEILWRITKKRTRKMVKTDFPYNYRPLYIKLKDYVLRKQAVGSETEWKRGRKSRSRAQKLERRFRKEDCCRQTPLYHLQQNIQLEKVARKSHDKKTWSRYTPIAILLIRGCLGISDSAVCLNIIQGSSAVAHLFAISLVL